MRVVSAAITHQQRAVNNTGKTMSSKWEVPSLVERFISNKLEHHQSMLSCSRAKISKKIFITAHQATWNVDQIWWTNNLFCQSSPFRISWLPMKIIIWLSHPSICEALSQRRKLRGKMGLNFKFNRIISWLYCLWRHILDHLTSSTIQEKTRGTLKVTAIKTNIRPLTSIKSHNCLNITATSSILAKPAKVPTMWVNMKLAEMGKRWLTLLFN